jgi:preprotein translocase subunit SecF
MSGAKSSMIIRAKKSALNQDELTAKIKELMAQKFPGNQLTIERTEYVGPAVGSQLFKQAMLALVFSFLGIIVYVAFRFHSGVWGASGVIGIMHDVFVIFGIFSILNKELTLTIVAALLTIAGYSINDTIVVFDRIRENMRLLAKDSFASVINTSINQTLSRTIITSLTVFLVALALYFLGGEVLHDFAFAMLLGVMIGTYSSIFVCSPLVYEWEESKRRRTAAMYADKRGGKK